MGEHVNFKNQRIISKLIILLWALIALFGWMSGLFDLFANWPLYFKGAATKSMMILRCFVSAMGLLIFCGILGRIRRKNVKNLEWNQVDGFILRAGLYTVLPALVIATILKMTPIDVLPEHGFVIRSAFYSFLWAGWMAWVLAAYRRLFCSHERSRANRRMKAIDLICMNCLVFLVLGELFSVGLNKTKLSILMKIENADAAARVSALRQEPGKQYFNFRLNSGGFHDEEFFAAEKSDLVVGFIGDSFGFGIVPYDFNFVTVAERQVESYFKDSFERIAIHNASMPGIAIDEYIWLLEVEILPLKPSFVVLCLFIGNDIHESADYSITSLQRYCFQNWYLYQYLRKIGLFVKEYKSLRRSGVTHGRSNGKAQKTVGSLPEYMTNTSKEKPFFSRDAFIQIESTRFEVCDPENPFIERGYQGVFSGLRFFQDKLGDNLLVVLMPDEFQVNDDLYTELLTIDPNFQSYERNYPQQRLTDFCKKRSIRCLDLLPTLRKGQMQDRTYHLQDTHLNAFGNKLVGSALGKELIDIVTEKIESGEISGLGKKTDR